jgi:hypothetical protein
VGTWEVNGAIVVGVHLVDHVLQLRFGWVLTQRAHDGTEFFGCDLTCVTDSAIISLASYCGSECHRAPYDVQG